MDDHSYCNILQPVSDVLARLDWQMDYWMEFSWSIQLSRPIVLRVVFHYRKYALPVTSCVSAGSKSSINHSAIFSGALTGGRLDRPRGALRTSRLLLGGGRWGESLGLDGESWWILEVGSIWVFDSQHEVFVWLPRYSYYSCLFLS